MNAFTWFDIIMSQDCPNDQILTISVKHGRKHGPVDRIVLFIFTVIEGDLGASISD